MRVRKADIDDDLLLLLKAQARERDVSIDVVTNEILRAELIREEGSVLRGDRSCGAFRE